MSSVTRNPVEYSKNSMELSLTAIGLEIVGGVSSFWTSGRESALGKLFPLLGRSIVSKGLCLTSFSLRRKVKNDLRAEIRLLFDLLDTFLSCRQYSRKL